MRVRFALSHRSRRTGLTLVEMLVVMGICGLLALLLVPMVLHSRGNARTVVCTNNLKGLGQAYTMCLMDNNGFLPEAYYTFEGTEGAYSVALKASEAGGGKLLSDGIASSLVCPSDDTPRSVAVNRVNGAQVGAPSSYGYNVALPLMFRNSSRVRQPVNTVTFFDGDLAVVAGEWKHETGWAANAVRARHGKRANYLYLDGHVETAGDFPDLAFDGGSLWLASSFNTPGPAPVPVAEPLDNTEPVDFIIDDGSVIPGEVCKATIICVGAAFQYGQGGPRIPVQAYYCLDGDDKVRITNDVRGGEQVVLDMVPAGTAISIVGKTTQYFKTERPSDGGDGHCWVLRDGDTVPSIAGFAGQRDAAAFLAPYTDEDGKVTIGKNDALFLFELSNETDYNRYSHADFQDLVVLVRFEKKRYTAGGDININPNNNSEMEFKMTLPSGTVVTRDDLHADKVFSEAGFSSKWLEYNGRALIVDVRPKGNGNQNGLTLNGQVFEMENSCRYVITSSNMNVHLYNDKRSKAGKAMGKWWIEITASNATIQMFKNGS